MSRPGYEPVPEWLRADVERAINSNADMQIHGIEFVGIGLIGGHINVSYRLPKTSGLGSVPLLNWDSIPAIDDANARRLLVAEIVQAVREADRLAVAAMTPSGLARSGPAHVVYPDQSQAMGLWLDSDHVQIDADEAWRTSVGAEVQIDGDRRAVLEISARRGGGDEDDSGSVVVRLGPVPST